MTRLLWVAFLLVGPGSAFGQTLSPAPVVGLAPATSVAVYEAALRFYDPVGGRMRWLDPTLLGRTDSLDPALAAELLDRMGDDFRPWNGEARGEGGVLRVSPPWCS